MICTTATLSTTSRLILLPFPHRYCHILLNTPLISNALFPLVSVPLAAAHPGAPQGRHGGPLPHAACPPPKQPPQCPHSDAALVDAGRVALRPLLGSKELMGARRVAGAPAVGRAGTGIQRAVGPKSCREQVNWWGGKRGKIEGCLRKK